MKHLFGFMFKDSEYIKKALPFFVLTFLTNIFYTISNANNPEHAGLTTGLSITALVFSTIAALISFITSGYGISCIKVFSEIGENNLPVIDYKNNFLTGLKFFIAVLFPILIYGFVLSGIFLLSNILSHTVINILYIFVITVAGIIYGYGSLGFMYLFANEGKILTFLRYKKVFNLVKASGTNYLKYFSLWAGIYILLGVLNALLIYGFSKIMNDVTFNLVYDIIKSIIPCYTVYLFGYFIAKSVKNTKNRCQE